MNEEFFAHLRLNQQFFELYTENLDLIVNYYYCIFSQTGNGQFTNPYLARQIRLIIQNIIYNQPHYSEHLGHRAAGNTRIVGIVAFFLQHVGVIFVFNPASPVSYINTFFYYALTSTSRNYSINVRFRNIDYLTDYNLNNLITLIENYILNDQNSWFSDLQLWLRLCNTRGYRAQFNRASLSLFLNWRLQRRQTNSDCRTITNYFSYFDQPPPSNGGLLANIHDNNFIGLFGYLGRGIRNIFGFIRLRQRQRQHQRFVNEIEWRRNNFIFNQINWKNKKNNTKLFNYKLNDNKKRVNLLLTINLFDLLKTIQTKQLFEINLLKLNNCPSNSFILIKPKLIPLKATSLTNKTATAIKNIINFETFSDENYQLNNKNLNTNNLVDLTLFQGDNLLTNECKISTEFSLVTEPNLIKSFDPLINEPTLSLDLNQSLYGLGSINSLLINNSFYSCLNYSFLTLPNELQLTIVFLNYCFYFILNTFLTLIISKVIAFTICYSVETTIYSCYNISYFSFIYLNTFYYSFKIKSKNIIKISTKQLKNLKFTNMPYIYLDKIEAKKNSI